MRTRKTGADLRDGLRRVGLVAVAIVLAGHAPAAPAQSADSGAYRLIGMPVGGGGMSTGATHRVIGAIVSMGTASGQGSEIVPGGGYLLSGALLGGDVPRSPEVRISVARRADGLFELTWPEAVGFILESSPAVWPRTDWTPVSPQPTDRVLVVTPSESVRYFRLRRM